MLDIEENVVEINSQYKYRKCDEIPDQLSMIFIHIPVPFEKGDLVLMRNGTPCVLTDIIHDYQGVKYNYEDFISGVACSDGSDFVAHGFYFCDTKLIWDADPYNLHDFIYFNGELQGHQEFLKYLSRYIKGKDEDLAWLLNLYYMFKTKSEYEKAHSMFDRWFISLEEEDKRYAEKTGKEGS